MFSINLLQISIYTCIYSQHIWWIDCTNLET